MICACAQPIHATSSVTYLNCIYTRLSNSVYILGKLRLRKYAICTYQAQTELKSSKLTFNFMWQKVLINTDEEHLQARLMPTNMKSGSKFIIRWRHPIN